MLDYEVRGDEALRASLSTGARAVLDAVRVRGECTWRWFDLANSTDIRSARVRILLDELAAAGALMYLPVDETRVQVRPS